MDGAVGEASFWLLALVSISCIPIILISQVGSELLLMDEDLCATNAMIRSVPGFTSSRRNIPHQTKTSQQKTRVDRDAFGLKRKKN